MRLPFIASLIAGGALFLGASSDATLSTWGGACGPYNFSLSYDGDADGGWTEATFSINGSVFGGSVLNSEAGTTTFKSNDRNVYYYGSGGNHSLTFKGKRFLCVNAY